MVVNLAAVGVIPSSCHRSRLTAPLCSAEVELEVEGWCGSGWWWVVVVVVVRAEEAALAVRCPIGL